MQAIILAAGRGERMKPLGDAKPMVSLLGMPLIERTVGAVRLCGIDNIIVVTGSQPEALQIWQQNYAKTDPGVHITLVHNDQWHDTENGQSLAAAAPHVRGDFLLLMADHVYVPELLADLCKAELPQGSAVLAVDTDIRRKDIDPDDVTHVQFQNDRVKQIGKNLHPHDGFDTGAFLCSAAVAVRTVEVCAQGRTRLSDTMQLLADEDKLLVHRIGGKYWQDVDTPQMHERARDGLLRWAAGKAADGPVARYINRPMSRQLTGWLMETRISPNQISLVAFAIGLIAALFLAQPAYWGLLIGGTLVQLASVVDGCDGEVARLRLRPSSYGGWLDALLDRYADAAVLAALTWHVMLIHQQPVWMWLGIVAISGSFISSYSAHKADSVMRPGRLRIGRDTRSLLVMVGAVLALPEATLVVVAVVMNAVVIARIFTLRHWGKAGQESV